MLAGVVILYKPDITIIKNIQTYLPFLNLLIVFDNTECKDEEMHEKLSQLNNVIVLHDGKNEGIAKRLNSAANVCIIRGFEWMLTMDQDSYFPENELNRYIQCVNQYNNSQEIAMFGVNYERRIEALNCIYTEVQHLITSGSIVNLILHKKIGGFDENLFIDLVDTDYCYQAQIKGYQIFKIESVFLQHKLGTVSRHRSLKDFRNTPRILHSPERIYYMIRNHFYLKKKYKKKIKIDQTRRNKDLLNRLKNNFLYGSKKGALVKYVVLGWIDYKKKKMGKYNNEFKN